MAYYTDLCQLVIITLTDLTRRRGRRRGLLPADTVYGGAYCTSRDHLYRVVVKKLDERERVTPNFPQQQYHKFPTHYQEESHHLTFLVHKKML